jgi:hypothetical protein
MTCGVDFEISGAFLGTGCGKISPEKSKRQEVL